MVSDLVSASLDLGDHPVDGGLDLLIVECRIAALGRHHADSSGVAFDGMFDQGFFALGKVVTPNGACRSALARRQHRFRDMHATG